MLEPAQGERRTPNAGLAASTPDQNVVQFKRLENPHSAEAKLKKVLADVGEGLVESVAIAVVYKSSGINTFWSETETAGLLIGAVALLQQRLCSDD